MASTALVTHVCVEVRLVSAAVSQVQILAGQGIQLDRATLAAG